MVPTYIPEDIYDPAELIHNVLESIWRKISRAYDVTASMPDVQALFDGADFSCPDEAAEAILVNMLEEVIESVGRFSPWYTRPARAFGLTSFRDAASQRVVWILAPEAAHKWDVHLRRLTDLIERTSGLIQAVVLVDSLLAGDEADDSMVVANCHCTPPRSIEIKRSVLALADIRCDACHSPFDPYSSGRPPLAG